MRLPWQWSNHNHRKKYVKVLFVTLLHYPLRYGSWKCRKERDIDRSWRKNQFLWLWGILNEYIQENIIMRLWRKQISIQFTVLDWWKINNVKEDWGEKTDSNFDFFRFPNFHVLLIRRNIVHILKLFFYTKEPS